MNTLELKGTRSVAKRKSQPKSALPPADAFQATEANEDELLNRLQRHTRESKEGVEKVLDECFADEL